MDTGFDGTRCHTLVAEALSWPLGAIQERVPVALGTASCDTFGTSAVNEWVDIPTVNQEVNLEVSHFARGAAENCSMQRQRGCKAVQIEICRTHGDAKHAIVGSTQVTAT